MMKNRSFCLIHSLAIASLVTPLHVGPAFTGGSDIVRIMPSEPDGPATPNDQKKPTELPSPRLSVGGYATLHLPSQEIDFLEPLSANGARFDPNPMDRGLAHDLGFSGFPGVLILEVKPTKSAAVAGLRSGDVVVSVGTKIVRNGNELVSMMSEHVDGPTTPVKVWRWLSSEQSLIAHLHQ
jgi:hypothetical protein